MYAFRTVLLKLRCEMSLFLLYGHSVEKSRTNLEESIKTDFVRGMWTRFTRIKLRRRRIWDKWGTVMGSNVKCYFINEDNILG